MNRLLIVAAVIISFGGSVSVHAQSFNIDLDSFSGTPEGGNGAPGSTFGGAAQSPGAWNRVYASGPTTPVALFGLDGVLTGAQIVATGGVGSSGGYNFHGNTGDYAALLNDFEDVGGSNGIQFHFSGLLPGHYFVYTFAVDPAPGGTIAHVTVPGSVTPTQIVSGPMPGNQFILGQTHCIHELQLNGDSFEVDVGIPGPPNPRVNGFQIVAVPEPGCFLTFSAAAVSLFARRRRPV